MANEPFLTFLVITDPAPIIEFLFSFNGATSDELDPTKTLSAIFSKICSFIYDGISDHSLYSFFAGVILFTSLYFVQKKRKNQISYDL